MKPRYAAVISHPIQYFTPLYREVARRGDVDLRVFYCTEWGLADDVDPEFQVPVKWDIPLLEGYDYEFLRLRRPPKRLDFWNVDNPDVADALERFDPHVVQVNGYVYRTNWRVVSWARRRGKLSLYASDSNAAAPRAWWRRAVKRAVVGRFYSHLDAALYTSENNRRYHRMYGIPEERLFPCVIPIERGRLVGSVPDRAAARSEIRARHGIPDDAFVVTLCAKYVARKRPVDLVAVSGMAARKGLPIWALLVGEGPERRAMEELRRAEGIENAVLTGFVNQSAIARYYAASDVVTLPSSGEALGLVVAEGASFGLPAVVSDRVGCIGPEDAARPGVNALVFPCGDREKYLECLEALFRDRELFARMSSASERISASLDAPAVARDLCDAVLALRRLGPR